MQIENIKAQAREEIAKLMPLADAATRESAVAVYLAGAAYVFREELGEVKIQCPECEQVFDEDMGGYIDGWILSGEVRNLMHARVSDAG